MRDGSAFYIGGEWTPPSGAQFLDVINPATEEVCGRIALGGAADVDRAVDAARAAFPEWSRTPLETRLAYLGKIAEIYGRRLGDVAAAISEEMGAPAWLATSAQAPTGLAHLITAIEAAQSFRMEEVVGRTWVVREPIGVCGFITPWNWPMNQIAAKFAPAIAMGCTIVHKPSEIAPFSAHIFAEIVEEAGLPAGVYNLVQGEGASVGAAIAAHAGVDMVSFTGSTHAGVEVARAAAPSVKRVHQELGGKSANIILDDADLSSAVAGGVAEVMMNSGQSCTAPARMLVPHRLMDEAAKLAAAAAAEWAPGDPASNARMGPVVSHAQWTKIQRLIETGIAEGARLVCGGPGKPEGLSRGYYVRPTVFSHVRNDMTIAREEIFGPVMGLIGYDSEDEAVAIANDTEYGLAGYVSSADPDRARRIARRIRAGYIRINGAGMDFAAPFGGYKRSGNGREYGTHAFNEFLELKSLVGYEAAG